MSSHALGRRFSTAPHDRKIILGREIPFRSIKQALSFAIFFCFCGLLVSAAALLYAPGVAGLLAAGFIILCALVATQPVLHSLLPVKLTIDCGQQDMAAWRKRVREQIEVQGYNLYRTTGDATEYFRMNVPSWLQWEQNQYRINEYREQLDEETPPSQHVVVVGPTVMVNFLRRKLERMPPLPAQEGE